MENLLPKFKVDINQPTIIINFLRKITSQDCDTLEIYFKYLCAYFCDRPQFCFDEDKSTLEILITEPIEFTNFSIFVRLLSSFYILYPNEKSIDSFNHYRCMNKLKFRRESNLIFQKSHKGFITRYLLRSLCNDLKDHWIIKQNKIFTTKISDRTILDKFHQFEKVLPIDVSRPQIVVTCAMISDFLEESRQILNQSFSFQPNDKIVPFWNMFLNKQEPITNNHHTQLALLMEIESKLTLMANKNIQWWVLFDFAMGHTKLYDSTTVDKFELFAGRWDEEPSISMLLTFAHFKDFFCASQLILDLDETTISKNTGVKFIQEISKPILLNSSKQKSRLWSDRVMSDDDNDGALWEDWSNQIDIEDDYGEIYADEA